MKILILANFDVGLYKFRKELIQELLKNHEVWISLPMGELVKPLEDMGCHYIDTPVDRRGINPSTDIKLLKQYRKILKQVNPDQVITYTIKPNIYGGIACRWAKIPYAVNITGLGTAFQKEGILKTLITKMYRYACKKAKTVYFENEENFAVLYQHGIVTKEQSVLLPGAGVNLEEYPFTQYPVCTEGYHFLFVGRVMQEKGMDELFYAAERIRRERQDVFFHIVGSYEDDYKKRIDGLVEAGIIQYHGYQEDVKPYIEKSHCFVLPSWHEGMANTLLECGSMGRPLITSAIHGCMEAVEERKNGLLTKVKDREDLYQKLQEFLSLPDEEKAEWGAASRTKMEQCFDKKKVVEKTVETLF